MKRVFVAFLGAIILTSCAMKPSNPSGMAKKPGLLIQAYWTMKQDNAMYILADTLKLQYRVSGNYVYFATLFRKEYLSIGLTAKPRDTPENHAMNYSKQLRQAYP